MTHFDFSSYHRPPPGLKVLRSDDELWLWREADRRYYRVFCPVAGEFVLCFGGEARKGLDETWLRVEGQQTKWEFILRSDSLFKILKALGALRARPQQKEQLQIPGTNLGVSRKR